MVCGGLWWFACIVSGFTADVPNSSSSSSQYCAGQRLTLHIRTLVVICGGLR